MAIKNKILLFFSRANKPLVDYRPALILLCFAVSLVANGSKADDNFRARLHQTEHGLYYDEDLIAEIRFGREVAARILGSQKYSDDVELIRYINLIGTALALNAPRSELRFHFAILNDNAINAYSAPGGYVFITQGALRLAQDEAEVAAILAHEIAHVSQRHIVRELNIRGTETSGISGITRLLGSAADTTRAALGQAIDKAMEIIFDRGYKIDDELEADRVATQLLAQSGYDPLALRRYLLRAEKVSGTSKKVVSRTHPITKQRIDELNRLIAEEGLDGLEYHTAEGRLARHVKSH